MDLNKLNAVFDALRGSSFRSRFKLGPKERSYFEQKGLQTILSHGASFITKRLAPAFPINDGQQTPWRGHPIFLAQHATGTCCRDCLAKWHGIAKGAPLDDDQQKYILSVFRLWLERQTQKNIPNTQRGNVQHTFKF